MTKIIHISPTYYSTDSIVGGGEKYVIYVARGLLKAARQFGVSVDMSLVAFGDTPSNHTIDADLSCELIVGRAWDANSLDAVVLRRAIADADIIFVHQCLCGFGLFIAAQAKVLGKYVVGLDHGGGEHPIINHTPEAGLVFDRFLAYSRFGAQAFSDLLGHVEIIQGPVDTDFYVPGELDADYRGVIAVGRLLPHKGFDRIIKALPSQLSLTIVGSRYDEAYFDYLSELSWGKQIQIVEGATDEELRQILQQAGLFVHASTHVDYRGTYYAKPELLGLAPLEALACGVPTLVSSAGALPELAVVDGCETFADDEVLGRLLRQHSDNEGGGRRLDRSKIAADLDEKFGLLQYGCRLLSMLGLINQ